MVFQNSTRVDENINFWTDFFEIWHINYIYIYRYSVTHPVWRNTILQHSIPIKKLRTGKKLFFGRIFLQFSAISTIHSILKCISKHFLKFNSYIQLRVGLIWIWLVCHIVSVVKIFITEPKILKLYCKYSFNLIL